MDNHISGSTHGTERRRLLTAASVGLVTGVTTALKAPWQLALLVGWDTVAAALLIWIWSSIASRSGAATKAQATRDDDSRATAFLLVVAAAIASLPGVALALLKATHETGAIVAALTATSVATIALSWGLVHTVYLLRYAHLYYREPTGGVAFPSEMNPDFIDFAYLSFTVGMTFQVSDTDIPDRAIRRVVLRHALISYLFGAVIVAVTINVLAGLFK